jgi:hypothetical protein
LGTNRPVGLASYKNGEKKMRNKGVLFYKLGSYFLILFALVHTLSFFSDPAELLTNEEDKGVLHLIQTHVFNFGSFSTTTKALLTGFSLYLEIFALFAGVLNFLIVRQHGGNPSFLKIMAGVNLVMLGLILVVTFIFFHLPPQILFGLTWLFFLLSFLFIRKLST